MSDLKRGWLAKVLGVVLPPAGPGLASGKSVTLAPIDPKSQLSRAARSPRLWTKPVEPGPRGSGRTPEPVTSPVTTGAKTSLVSRTGKKLEITVGADGRVALTADPAPIREITFSGGGGKGAALPGAVKALEETGTLAQIQVFHGASVGSMTAAMLAAGMSADEFTRIANDTKMGPIIKAGDILPLKLKGDGLEAFIRKAMGNSVQSQIKSFLGKPAEPGAAGPDPQAIETLKAIDAKIAAGGGVTFGDLRALSKIIPGVKELVISGTKMGDDSGAPGRIGKDKPQLTIFSAETEPDLDVALAVHASAALPPVFKPVDIKLASGVTARFQDGGVLNNAPTSDLIGTDRALDPVPEAGKMTFVFEEDASKDILKGQATPNRSRLNDFISGAPNSAAEYAKNRGLADRPEEIIMVPLKFDGPWYKRTDFSGFIGGTVNFDIRQDARLKLQDMTAATTLAHVEQRKLPETWAFASTAEMLNCVGRSDLEAMAEGDFPGAKEALLFRDAVAAEIAGLEQLAEGDGKAAFDRLDTLAEGDRDRLAFIGRELNRSGKLDALLARAQKSVGRENPALAAGNAVATALSAHGHAQTVLREIIYPKMVRESPKSVAGIVLKQVDTLLRGAKSPEDVNKALTIAIRHFEKKSDFGGLHGHHAFAAELKTCLMPVT
jgi:exoenzyme U